MERAVLRLDGCPHWADPVPAGVSGMEAIDAFVPYYKRLVELVDPVHEDAIVAQDWEAALNAFDMEPLPQLRDIWILRWRRLVVDIWRILDAHTRRLAARPAARRVG